MRPDDDELLHSVLTEAHFFLWLAGLVLFILGLIYIGPSILTAFLIVAVILINIPTGVWVALAIVLLLLAIWRAHVNDSKPPYGGTYKRPPEPVRVPDIRGIRYREFKRAKKLERKRLREGVL